MTKPQEPVSIENALMAVIGRMTIERASEVTGRKVHYLRALTDRDKPTVLNVADLETLDLEAHALWGEGFPLYEALGRRLDSSKAERFPDQIAIARAAAKHAKEAGEASAAMIQASLSTDPRVLRDALREAEESDAAADEAVAVLREALRRATEGPS
ncbi:hypothetical protein CA235_09565 [Sphingomonas sp. ABOLF]|uniref:hypothetical protein n=1 Tax=Sphingomonas sp. ABOLF TaxID=1985879 RepID=UPI000F7EC1F4|nr:hypothetical protein [Sphingomonas sp. ABOLF]RSV15174.1 hypothetical protein CA235_09565 [Sphingomonas sp. ABOLF]